MWTNYSDKRRRFFMGDFVGSVDQDGIQCVSDVIVEFLVSTIASEGSGRYDRLFLQVNSDTGLLLATLGDDAGFVAGTTEGLGIRWYGLAERYDELGELDAEARKSNLGGLETAIHDACLAAARSRRGDLLSHTSSDDIELYVVDPFEPMHMLRKNKI